jgi:hypothetical protein
MSRKMNAQDWHDEYFKALGRERELLDALTNSTIALADIMRLSQVHDPETGYFRPVDPNKAYSICQNPHVEGKKLIAASGRMEN